MGLLERINGVLARMRERGGSFGSGRDEDRGIWGSWGNLNERPGNAYGSALQHGRVTVWLDGARAETALRCEWVWRLEPSAHVQVILHGPGSDDDLTFGASTPFGALYFGVFSRALARVRDRLGLPAGKRADGRPVYEDRQVRLAFHDGTLHWKLWSDQDSWDSRTPRWRDGNFNVVDAVLGKPVHATRIVLHPMDVVVPMPERSYRGTCTLEEGTWKRPRWFAERFVTAKIDMQPGEQIPIPGKGENSWDCDEDATYGMSTRARSVPDAIGQLVASTLSTRERRAGPNWRPEKREGVLNEGATAGGEGA